MAGQPSAPMATSLPAVPALTATVAPQPKKRGRKKGSKGVDGRLAANLVQKMQSGSQYDTLSLMSLKNQIDSMRGNAKKVKTTKELLAELQNRNTAGAGFDSSNSNAIGGGIGSNFGSRTSSPIATSHYPFVASPSGEHLIASIELQPHNNPIANQSRCCCCAASGTLSNCHANILGCERLGRVVRVK